MGDKKYTEGRGVKGRRGTECRVAKSGIVMVVDTLFFIRTLFIRTSRLESPKK